MAGDAWKWKTTTAQEARALNLDNKLLVFIDHVEEIQQVSDNCVVIRYASGHTKTIENLTIDGIRSALGWENLA